MVPIKHILYEYGVEQIFKLVVPTGEFTGTYIIKQPIGWDEVDSIVNMNEETFNVEDFIIGSNTKVKFSEYTDKTAYDIIRNVYNEQGGDGRIIFKWIAEKNNVEYDLIGENFELNLNKYVESPEKNYMKIELELIKSEAQNKIFTREDTTVNLFEEKDLDENPIEPVPTFDIGFKKGDRILSNFYTNDITQRTTFFVDHQTITRAFPSFRRSDDYEFGVNTNEFCGYRTRPLQAPISQGPFVTTNITLKKVKIEISNMSIGLIAQTGTLYANISGNGNERLQKLKESVPDSAVPAMGVIVIDNEFFELENGLLPGESLSLEIRSNSNDDFFLFNRNRNVSIEITTDLESPLVRTKAIRLIDGINQLVKNYSSGAIHAESFALGTGGIFYDTSISTGLYLRGLPAVYLSQKMKTSLKDIFQDGAAKLLGLGFDVIDDKYVVENIEYFFKDQEIYDLSQRQYLIEDFSLENDNDVSFNTLLFGSKKYSTNQKFDIRNFNTAIEISTPIKSNKNKLDKQTNLIIDPYKIKELIEDKSSSTNDNDDDKILVDMVNVTNYWDYGVFENCVHTNDSGTLQLSCAQTPFDTTLMEVGQTVEIVEGLNSGLWVISDIEEYKIKLNPSSGSPTISEGTYDTPIRYKIDSITKNRTIEGFTDYGATIWSAETTANIRHNPKYQMARWWPFFGSGLRKKLNTELLKVTSYKNNSEAKMKIVPPDMPNDLRDEVIVGGNETLARMRDYKQTFFNGESIVITFSKVTFEEFYLIYSNWIYGEGNDRTKSRGYISCNTPFGIYDVYPFGPEMFKHNKSTNTLTIKGKVKGKSVNNPILLSVVQEDRNTVTLTWDYVVEYVNPMIKIQYSLDGTNWETVHTVSNVKTATFSNAVFNSIMTGTNVYFRIIANTSDYYNKVSNTRLIEWQFNDWVINEISRTENINCGYSYLTLEITGTVDLEIKWHYEDVPGGGNYTATDLANTSLIASYDSPYGTGNADEQTTTMNLSNESKTIYIQLKNSDKTDAGTPLNCNTGNMFYTVQSDLDIEFKDLSTGEITSYHLQSRIFKKYIDISVDPDPEGP